MPDVVVRHPRWRTTSRSHVTVVEDFHHALAASAADLPGSELLPERLARACALVLPVDGAGISLFFLSDRRLPLGASDPESSQAERLQFTSGEGPCLTSHVTGEPVLADESSIRARWPAFYDGLVTHTRIRGTISIPLRDELRGIGALDLYLVPPRGVGSLSLQDALLISGEVAAVLQAQSRQVESPSGGPAWLDAPAAERRSTVWQAIGFVNASLHVSSPDALALLRAHAFAAGSSLEDVAARVLDRTVPVQELALDSDSPR
ncbi:GAF domain-containing protein [Modestobacter sp. VKM Ac-2676]|nr:GAF domain-containing protein [Modestobacter sp. VKM Ac-2676]